MTALVTGEKNALITTTNLFVNALGGTPSISRRRDRDAAWIDIGNKGGSETKHVYRDIDWESTTVFPGEPNPSLRIDASGRITELVNLTGRDGQGSPLVLGGTVGAGTIVLDPIVNDFASRAVFTADRPIGIAEVGRIWGNAAIFDYLETWEYVTIVNESAHDIVIDDIAVVKAAATNEILINVQWVPNNDNATFRVTNVSPTYFATFDFAIVHTYLETVVTIHAAQASGTDWDIILAGVIDNPIGSTIITAERGDIENSAGTDQLIRTNVLDLDAPLGSIGSHTSVGMGRVPINVQLIESDYTDDGVPPASDPLRHVSSGTYTEGKTPITRSIAITADAAGDVVLDLASHRAADATRRAADAFVIALGPITAGGDIDMVIGDSYDRTAPPSTGTVRVYKQAGWVSSTYPQFSPQYYGAFFRPDSTAGWYELGSGATGTTAVTAHYLSAASADDFTDPEPGDRPTGETAYLTAGDRIALQHLTSGDVTYTGIVDTDANTDGVGSVLMVTTGFVNLEERLGDLRVDVVASSAGDVTLWALTSIVDAEADAVSLTTPDPFTAFALAAPGVHKTDVRGVNITLYAGLGGVTGGIGAPTNWLEIDVDVQNGTGETIGVLNAHDVTAASTAGIFLYETDGTLQVDTIETTSHVSLRTVNGSIVDAREDGAGDDEWNIRARSIDLDANGGSIGSPDGLNDLEIDSTIAGALATDDVGLEASTSIFLTETDGFLRLVMAHAENGNIRLTVRESADLDEHLYLVELGQVRFAESGADLLRTIGNGYVGAAGTMPASGNVLLRVGDNIDTHQNSRIWATSEIDVYGDWENLDPGYGSTMVFRGDITAGYLVNGSNSPPRLTEIWGNTDADTIQFGDASGLAMGTTLGSAGYIHLGSQTRAYGGNVPPTSTDPVPPADDGEDRFIVFYLQTMNVAAGHTLTLDGQADTDTYTVHTTGSRAPAGGVRDYVINILDTGAPLDGADEAFILGADTTDPTYTGPTGLNDDVFLLRASTCIPAAGGYGCTGATETANGPAFVALLHGSVTQYADLDPATQASSLVQRVNYDRALNGRLTVLGLGGNDHFYADDTTTTITLDGGAGDDVFQIGQVFGTKRDAAAGGVRPQDIFPDLIATTRGWLSPGTHAPLVATGGTGSDQFTVYSNQAELRLEGDDDNDVFVVRAFALAAVQSTDPTTWTDDVIPLVDGVASPLIGGGYSTGRPLDIRTGGGDDEVQYNVNAPVSVEGGTGIDKLVVLATEFADDIVITAARIYGGGLNVRYSTVEIVEVDGLEGDDEFFVQSTAFGVAYRVIGGLGSDTINVTGDVTEDIVVRELEGLSGTIDHLVRSAADPGYDGLTSDGIETNVVRGGTGLVLIEESDGFTAVREGGPVAVDAYSIRLARAPSASVYVTVSAAQSPQEEAGNAASVNLANLAQGLPTGAGETIWLCTGTSATACDDASEFRRYVYLDGVLTAIDRTALVLEFTATTWATPQWVYVYAVDDARSEGDRVHVVQHTVISTDSAYDGTAVRNVEVQVRDNDTPGVSVTPVKPGTSTADGRTLVVEGSGAGLGYTGLDDEVLVQLTTDPGAGVTIVVQLVLDESSAAAVILSSADTRWNAVARTITFTGGPAGDWDDAVRIAIRARDDDRPEDRQIAVVGFTCGSTATCGAASGYRIPNFRSGTGLLDIEVVDDETPGLLVIETGTSTIVVDDDPVTGVDESTLLTSQDTYTIRLTRAPDGTVTVAVLTDGLTDVVSINGVPVVLQPIGGYVPTRLFAGQITISGTSITRGSDSDLGSFLDEGFAAGQFVRVTTGAGTEADPYVTVDATVTAVTEQTMTLSAIGALGGTDVDATISRITRAGQWQGTVTTAADAQPTDPSALGGRRITRTDGTSWLADGFLEGQRVRITNAANTSQFVDLKIAIIRGTNATFDETLQFTAEGATPSWWLSATAVVVTRLAAVATFTSTNWFAEQTVVLKADPLFALPLVRTGVKTFPASEHLLSNLRGPLAVEGGVTGADRSLTNGVKLPGEKDGSLFGIAGQAPESRQIDVLNIFNDSSQQDLAGVMTSTTLTGFGMAKELVFPSSNPFGEPTTVPGGISYGTISYDGSQYATDGGKTSIEVLNVLLGSGNDSLAIQGTLDPAQAVSAVGTFTSGTTTITRTGPVTWRDLGFLAGQTLTVSGVTGSWTITEVSADGLTLTLGAALGTVGDGVRTVAATDPAVAGSGTAVGTSTGGTVTRTSGTWAADGFVAGQLVMVSGQSGYWRVVGIDGAQLTLKGAPLASGAVTVTVPGPHGGLTVVHGGGNRPLEFVGTVTGGTGTLTRADGLSWSADGFVAGQVVQVSGETGTRSVVGFGNVTCTFPAGETGYATCGQGAVLYLSGGAVTGGEVTLHVVDVAALDGVRIGGDTITVCSATAKDEKGVAVPCGPVLAGPESPLVIYGDTSQDGLWYSGDPETVDGHEFGPKPFDPFYWLADGDNEDDEWVFPLGNPFDHAGNDVIDASRLFAGVACTNSTCTNLPSVGVTIYGGAGNDTIIGSQAGDHLAGGSGDDLILGQRGNDLIYGDSGINVDLLTRALTIVNVNAGSTSPMVDELLVPGADTLYGEGAGTVGTAGTGTETGYDDVIFGDYGVVTQLVSDPNLPDPLAQRIQTTGYIRDIATARPDLGGDDTIDGGPGRDRVLGGNGSDTITDNSQSNVVFGDHGHLQYVAGSTDVTVLHLVESIDEARGGVDHITTGAGSDFVFGGAQGDVIAAGAGANVVFGDHGRILGVEGQGANRPIDPTALYDYQLPVFALIEGFVPVGGEFGGVDDIDTGVGADIVFGGAAGDDIDANEGETTESPDSNNVVFGDYGFLDFVVPTYPGDASPYSLDRVWSDFEGFGGDDTITTGVRNDFVFGGLGGDTIEAGAGHNVVFGDHGRITGLETDAPNHVPVSGVTDDLPIAILQLVEGYVPGCDPHDVSCTLPEHGGDDTITTGIGRDMIVGGAGVDTIVANVGETPSRPDGNTIVFGDYGLVDYLISGDPKTGDSWSGDPADTTRDIDRVWSTFVQFGGDDHITTGAGNDIVIGGIADDTITAGEGTNLVFGDNARLTSLPDTGAVPQTIYAVHEFAIGIIESWIPEWGQGNDGNDTIHGSPLADIIMGGGGSDVIFGGDGDDLIFGDDGLVRMLRGIPYDPRNLNGLAPELGGAIDFRAINTTALSGNGNDDLIVAGAGNDIVLGQQGSDVIYGEGGDDILTGGSNVSGAYDTWDVIDGGAGTDLLAGDNAEGWRRADALDPRMRVLSGMTIYGTTGGTDGRALVTGQAQNDPTGVQQYLFRILDHSDTSEAAGGDTLTSLWGSDYLAGGPGADEIFGQLGDDVVMGDAYVDGLVLEEYVHETMTAASPRPALLTDGPTGTRVGAWRGCTSDPDDTLCVNPAHRDADPVTGRPADDHSGDGDDYIEGGGGSDTIFGGLGQDDIIGDNSDLYGLTSPELRPAGADMIFGGAGTAIDRNNIGAATLTTIYPADTIITLPTGHARDADAIAGDNAQIFRLVGSNGTPQAPNAYLTFNYDDPAYNPGGLRLIPRAVEFLDYTLGGPAYAPASAASDRGEADEIHGEAGDDWIYGMRGDDVLYGDGQDDDIVGGYGNDWISGGTGDDAVIGDDGRISTSRNSSVYGEPLYGIAALKAKDPDTRAANGDVLNEVIYTPGQVQKETINVGGVLKKTVNLTPFNVDPAGAELYRPAGGYDDIVFGGLGNDAIHGGSGDDALSGAEALVEGWARDYSGDGAVVGIVRIDFGHPVNPGDVLRYNPEDPDGWHYDRTQRAGEFDLYDEYEPRREIRFNDLGEVWTCTGYSPSGHTCTASAPIADYTFTFFLTNTTDEGYEFSGCTSFLPNGTCTGTGIQRTDGNDVLFGDLGNDWIVGGTGHDTLWGGWGNDLLQADDVLTTNGSLNDVPETHPMFEDRAYGGAGRDVLIGNTGGDRLIDWIGEFNSYIVPFAPFGIATVSRQRPPALDRFLYVLSAAQGADPTRALDEGSLDAARNGEPGGEIGLVTPRDGAIWRDQSGAPADPQAGNIPGGRRDVLRSANFNDGTLTGFAPDSGVWEVTGAVLTVAADSLGQDASAVFYLDQALPTYYEIRSAVSVLKPLAGWKANAFLIFDYMSPTDFKFAGLDASTNKVVIGHRTATGWLYDTQVSMLVKQGRYYEVLVVVSGLLVTVYVDGVPKVSYQFAPWIIDGEAFGINLGLVGVGSDNSRGAFDNFAVSVLPPQETFDETEDFADDTLALQFTGDPSAWSAAGGGYAGTAPAAGSAISLIAGLPARVAGDTYLELAAVISGSGTGGLVFDHYAADDFKYVTFQAGTVTIGHMIRGRWIADALFPTTLTGALQLVLEGATVTVSVGGTVVGSFTYNAPVLDGELGLLSSAGTTVFDDVRVFVGTHFINVIDPYPPVLTVPRDVTRNTDPGQPTAFVSDSTIGTATATDNVEGVVVTREGVPAGNIFPIGVTTITWTARDVFGNVTFGTQRVTIVDAERPVLVVPPNVAREIPTGQTSATLTAAELGTATATDNSGSVTVTSSGIPAGLVFPLGTTTITWTATDPSGNVTTGLQTVTITTPLPAVTVVATDANGAEAGPDTITFVVTRSLTQGALAVTLAWSGTATYGVDYTAGAVGGTLAAGGGTVTFDPGVAAVTLTVTPIDDVVAEAAEAVVLAVVAGVGYAVGAPSSAIAEIVSDDTAPVTSTVGVVVTDGAGAETGSDPVVFTVARVGDASAQVVIALAWTGTAVLGTDYTVSVTGGSLSTDRKSLTLAAGVTSAVVTVTPGDDAVVEATETVVLSVLAGTGYVLGSQTSASGTISDNDVAPTLPVVSITATDPTGAETTKSQVADTITFTLTRTGDISKSLVVGYSWFGTAKLGKDFTAEAVGGGVLGKTTVTFAAGQATLTILITPIDDTTVEPVESVTMTLKAGTGYTLGAQMSATGSITDNEGGTAATSAASTSTSVTTSAESTPATSTQLPLGGAEVSAEASAEVTTLEEAPEGNPGAVESAPPGRRRTTFDLVAV